MFKIKNKIRLSPKQGRSDKIARMISNCQQLTTHLHRNLTEKIIIEMDAVWHNNIHEHDGGAQLSSIFIFFIVNDIHAR